MPPRSCHYRRRGTTILEIAMPAKGTIPRVCGECGTTFLIPPKTANREGAGRFCSHACAGRSGRRSAVQPYADRVLSKVQRTDGCWIWTGQVGRAGYGLAEIGGVGRPRIQATRAVYELLVGPIPDGLQLDHLCRNPICVRPDHLEPVTPAENSRRGLNGALRPGAGVRCTYGHPYVPNQQRCLACHRERERKRRERIQLA